MVLHPHLSAKQSDRTRIAQRERGDKNRLMMCAVLNEVSRPCRWNEFRATPEKSLQD
jgi:hypothetical protein